MCVGGVGVVCACVHAHGGQRLRVDTCINLSSRYSWRQSLSLDLEFTESVEELASNPQECFCLCSLKAGVTRLQGCWGLELGSWCLSNKLFTRLPRP